MHAHPTFLNFMKDGSAEGHGAAPISPPLDVNQTPRTFGPLLVPALTQHGWDLMTLRMAPGPESHTPDIRPHCVGASL